MAYCVKCGARVDDDCKFCTECGAQMPDVDTKDDFRTDNTQEYTYDSSYTYDQADDYNRQSYSSQNNSDYFDEQEVKKNKAMGVLSYLGILVFIPLIAGDKRSQYVRFHSNQGLVLFLTNVIVDLLDGDWVYGLHSLLNLGSVFETIFDVLGLILFIMMIVGIVTACKGEKRELPVIGKIKILK